MSKVGLVSLGCAKNLVDSEVMLGLLARSGHQITSSPAEAEIIVVNTCGFIEGARQESIDTILEMAQQKISGRCRKLVVTGCLVERYRAQIQEQIPEVDAVMGTNEIPRILELCGEDGTEIPPRYESRELYLYSDADPRLLTTPSYTAYLKIAEGCDHPCAFCVIPQMRGRFRSRPLQSVLAEARRLAAQGVREINLVAQDSTQYLWDQGNRLGLAQLIRRLGEIEELQWIRFLYAYPNSIYPDLLEALSETPKACKYLDLPLQHASRQVLKRMKRGGSADRFLRLMERIRRSIPGVAIRTTMIVGFPGETEEDFEELVDFVKQARFDRLGVFTYSDEEDCAAFHLNGKVPEKVKRERRRRLMKLQSGISKSKNRELVGRSLPVLLEGVSRESDMLWEGRLSTQAPEIDGVVYVTDGIRPGMKAGEIREVRITQAHTYDLVGVVDDTNHHE